MAVNVSVIPHKTTLGYLYLLSSRPIKVTIILLRDLSFLGDQRMSSDEVVKRPLLGGPWEKFIAGPLLEQIDFSCGRLAVHSQTLR